MLTRSALAERGSCALEAGRPRSLCLPSSHPSAFFPSFSACLSLQIDAHASLSLAKAAEVLVGKLEQKNSINGPNGLSNALNGSSSTNNSFRLHGRFAETPRGSLEGPQALEVQTLPLPPAAAAMAPPTVDLEPQQPRRASPEAQQPQQQQQPLAQHHLAQFEGQTGLAAGIGGIGGLRRSGGSTGSQQSLSSVCSVPHSQVSTATQAPAAAQPAAPAEPTYTGYAAAVATHPPNLSRLSPPPRPPSAPTVSQQQGQGQGQAFSPRPGSPPTAATTSLPASMPSPNQRVLRSSSLDAISLLSRTASMPPGGHCRTALQRCWPRATANRASAHRPVSACLCCPPAQQAEQRLLPLPDHLSRCGCCLLCCRA